MFDFSFCTQQSCREGLEDLQVKVRCERGFGGGVGGFLEGRRWQRAESLSSKQTSQDLESLEHHLLSSIEAGAHLQVKVWIRVQKSKRFQTPRDPR